MNLRIVNRTYFQNLKIKIVTNNTPLVDGCCSTYGVDKSRLRMVDVRTLVLTLRISTETFYRHRNMDLRVSEKCVQCSLDLKPKMIQAALHALVHTHYALHTAKDVTMLGWYVVITQANNNKHTGRGTRESVVAIKCGPHFWLKLQIFGHFETLS